MRALLLGFAMVVGKGNANPSTGRAGTKTAHH